MKKIGSAVIMFLFPVSAYSMVNIELDIGLPMGIQNTQNVKYSWSEVKGERMDLALPDGTSEDSSGMGLEFRGNFFFISPNKYIDFGVEAGFGFLMWGTTSFSDGLPGSGEWNDAWSNWYALCGPVLRVNFNSFASVSFSAGFKPLTGSVEFENSLKYKEASMAGVDAYFSVSGKLWVTAKRIYHFGFNTGVNFFTPVIGYYSFTPSVYHTGGWNCEYDINNGFGMNLYVGVCFNLGTMSLDRF